MKKFLATTALALCLSGGVYVCKTYAQEGISASISQIDYDKLGYIVMNGSVDDLKQMLSKKIDINKIFQCSTFLNLAIQSMVSNEKGPNLNSPTIATEKVRMLVNAGANVNTEPCPRNTMSPLGWAISLITQSEIEERNFIEAIEIKMLKGQGNCNIAGIISKPCENITYSDRQMIKNKYHNVFKSVRKLQVPQIMEVIKILTDNGADINQKNFEGLSPLHLAANISKEESLEPLKYLLTKGADVNTQDIRGNTPLFAAFAADNDNAIKLLIEAGADTNIRNNNGLLYSETQKGSKYTVIRK